MISADHISFLDGNLHVLKRQNPATYRWLASCKEGMEIPRTQLMLNRWGLPDWPLPSGKGLFDAITPESAYGGWIPEDEPETGATLIVGSNLGYGIQRVLSGTGPTHRVWVLEPRPEMLTACLSQTDYRPFIESKRLVFLPPDEKYFKKIIWQLDVEYVFGKVFVLADLPSHQIGPEYAMWTQRCKTVLERFGADLNTLRLHQDEMVQNELSNFARALNDGDLSPLREKGRGVHAVIYGAGPSLARFGPMIAQESGSCLHACGLQVLPALYAFGLKPHFCMAIDYTKAMKKVCDGLDREWAKDIPLIYSRKVDPEAVAAYPGPTLPIWTVGGIGTFMPSKTEVVLNGGGSVGVALKRFLTWCGVHHILLVGFDFSWKGKKTHVAGHLAEKHDFHFDPNRHVPMQNKSGETIYSHGAYITALRDLESDLRETPTKVSNLYGGGARIDGAPEVSYEETKETELFQSKGQALEHFLHILNKANGVRQWPTFEARSVQWTQSIRSVMERLKRLFLKIENNQGEVCDVLYQIVVFLKQDPLYFPYLFNEILEMTRLARSSRPYEKKALSECGDILKRVLKKVSEVDNCLVHRRRKAA